MARGAWRVAWRVAWRGGVAGGLGDFFEHAIPWCKEHPECPQVDILGAGHFLQAPLPLRFPPARLLAYLHLSARPPHPATAAGALS